MFTLVIGLFVTGAAIVFAIRLALSAEPKPVKPAMPALIRDREQAVAVQEIGIEGVGALRRARSGVLLLIILTALGALLALLIVVGGAIVLTGLRSAVQ